LSCGIVGRLPDHIGSTLAGLRMGLAAFRPCDPARAATLDDCFTYAPDNDLFLPYVIINAHARRSYEKNAAPAFDCPPSSRFKENDADAYFENVKIPWGLRLRLLRFEKWCKRTDLLRIPPTFSRSGRAAGSGGTPPEGSASVLRSASPSAAGRAVIYAVHLEQHLRLVGNNGLRI
jgi:hypothetical protein